MSVCADSGTLTVVNQLLRALAGIGTALGCLRDVVECLKRHLAIYDIVVDESGRHFRALIPKLEPTQCYLPIDDLCAEVADCFEYIPEWTNNLWSTRDDADKAIALLPEELNRVLSELTGKPWRETVRRTLIDAVTVWPGETLSGYALGSKKVKAYASMFLKLLDENDPCPQWRDYEELTRIYAKDLLAARGAIPVRLTDDKPKTPPVAQSISSSVLLFGPSDKPIVNGIEKKALSTARYDTVRALLEAGDKGLTKDELDRQSNHGDARKVLKRLADSDADWASVIRLAEKTGNRYRIL